MQSKTSFFNTAVLRKDITRFAPIWGGYTLCALLVMLLASTGTDDYNSEFYFVQTFGDLVLPLAFVNCGYALVVAQALFGDLYNSRSCYALHAMPLRRETWYCTHVVSGLLFALVPNLVLTLVSIPLVAGSCVVKGWMVPVYAFLGLDLQYIFFFGVAVFASFCTGNRLGMLIVYGVLNLGVAVAGLLVEAIYLPLLFGVTIVSSRYTPFSPVAHMAGYGQRSGRMMLMEFEDFYDLKYAWEESGMGDPLEVHFSVIPETWGYYAICAAIGIALLVIGIWLYKKRQLECAGDLLAFKCLEPVFMFIFSALAGAGFQLLYVAASNEANDNGNFLFMAIGLVIGWFVGKMLLERSTRVFTKKNLPGLAIVAAFMAVTLGLTWLDPFNVEGWLPEAHEVASVTFGQYNGSGETPIDNPAEIQEFITLHKLALEQHLELKDSGRYRELKEDVAEAEATEADYRYAPHIYLEYQMKDGSTVIRQYNVWLDSEAGQLAKKRFSAPNQVLTNHGTRFELEEVAELYVEGMPFADFADQQDIQSLWAALYADCEAGNMARDEFYHTGYFKWVEGAPGGRYSGGRNSLDMTLGTENSNMWLQIYPDSENTINWLTERGILEELGFTVVPNEKRPAFG